MEKEGVRTTRQNAKNTQRATSGSLEIRCIRKMRGNRRRIEQIIIVASKRLEG